MKIKSNFYRLILVIAGSLSAVSCMVDMKSIKGSGKVITQNRHVGEEFTKIDASSGIDVVVSQSDTRSVTVEADDNVQQHIKTKVENGTLFISSEYNSFTNVTKKVIVTLPAVNSIQTSGGASLKSSNTLRSDDLTIDASSGSEVRITVEADKLVCQASSGSHVTAKGKALTVDTSSSSGSEIDAAELLANDVHAQSSSGSSSEVHALVNLNAEASSGSSIDYVGSPKKVVKEENSGGSISGK